MENNEQINAVREKDKVDCCASWQMFTCTSCTNDASVTWQPSDLPAAPLTITLSIAKVKSTFTFDIKHKLLQVQILGT